MNSKLLTTFKNLGLTDNESKIYMALLDRGTSTISGVAASAAVNRRNTYDVINTLVTKGLVFQVIGQGEHTYSPVHPNKLLELVQNKEVALQGVMPSMEHLYNQPAQSEYAVIYKGIEGFKQYMKDILSSGATEVFCIGAKGGWDYPALGSFRHWFEDERKKRDIVSYDLLDHEMRDYTRGQSDMNDTARRRFLPPGSSTNSAVVIFGDHVVTFTGLTPERIESDVTLFVMISPDIADGWRQWFQFMWDRC